MLGVGHFEGDVFDAVAVLPGEARDLALGREGGGKHEANLALLEDVAGAVAHAGFEAGIGDGSEAEGGGVPVDGLFGVAHVELDVVPVLDGHEVVVGHAESTSRIAGNR